MAAERFRGLRPSRQFGPSHLLHAFNLHGIMREGRGSEICFGEETGVSGGSVFSFEPLTFRTIGEGHGDTKSRSAVGRPISDMAR